MSDSVRTEPLPGYSLVKYGDVITVNFNEQFAKRLHNVMSECMKTFDPVTCKGSFANLKKYLAWTLSLVNAGDPAVPQDYDVHKFEHVYTLTFGQHFGIDLNKELQKFLAVNQVSPPLFSFAKQLESCLFPKRKGVGGFADE